MWGSYRSYAMFENIQHTPSGWSKFKLNIMPHYTTFIMYKSVTSNSSLKKSGQLMKVSGLQVHRFQCTSQLMLQVSYQWKFGHEPCECCHWTQEAGTHRGSVSTLFTARTSCSNATDKSAFSITSSNRCPYKNSIRSLLCTIS